jgi:hypothetical protein
MNLTVQSWTLRSDYLKSDNGIKIDIDDFRLVKNRRVAIHESSPGRFYAVVFRPKRTYLHHLITGEIPKDKRRDHINRDTLDNRRSNLRVVTPLVSTLNRGKHNGATSKFYGVSRCINTKTVNGKVYRYQYWRMAIAINGKQVASKVFKTEIEAAKAYNAIVKLFHGEHAQFNDV